ncbi:hypothetical protein OHB49_28895 [Streptomyces sp. NBC_01717]|uniref:hypothetical protein n=1 Tax=Streptomyces sp. NBC_01717 TaxID=2975918 RepID=UPI002E34A709|nr:hypothetical protein [Streptomyces sp. NBC_01717]
MTETYAATIAAVVPVIWLVGVVEVHQIAKLAVSGARQIEDAARAGEQILKEAGDRPSFEVVARASHQMTAQIDKGSEELRAFPPLPLAYFWTAFVSILLAAEALSLYWLGVSGGPHPGWAWFCFLSTVVGFGAITAVPAAFAYRQMTRSVRLGRQRYTAVQTAMRRRLDEISTEQGA